MARRTVYVFAYGVLLFLCVLLGVAIGMNFSLDNQREPWKLMPPKASVFLQSEARRPSPPCNSKDAPHQVELPKIPKVEPLNIDEILDSCPSNTLTPWEAVEKALDEAIVENKCSKLLDQEDFMCMAQCARVEPELEQTVRILRTGNHSAEWLIAACKKKVFPILVWLSTNGQIRYMYCVKESDVVGPELWREAQKFLVMIACLVNISPRRDILFAFDASDYSTPTWNAPYDLHQYINFQPAILRFVGTRAHSPLLFPTTSHLVVTGFCDFRNSNGFWRFCYDTDDRLSIPYKDRSKELMWRGLPTGAGWRETLWTFMQRMALVRDYGRKPGFDVGFVRGVKQFANSSELLRELVVSSWVVKPKIEKHDHSKYAFVLHVDGNTASWGISHKIMSRSTLVWVESQHDFREHFYHLLKPWIHYVPVAVDMSDLDAVKDWLLQHPVEAERIAQNARHLAENRMKPTDTLCYVFRLLASIAAAQQSAVDPRIVELDEHKLRDMMGQEMFAKFSEPSAYQKIRGGKMSSVYKR